MPNVVELRVELGLQLLAGLVAGAAFLAFARLRGPRRERRVLSIGLAVAALLYLIFALARSAPTRWLAVEFVGFGLFGALAWLGWRRARGWLALGWAVHPVWDVGLHGLGPGAPFAPQWYAVLCTSFDLLVALYIATSHSYEIEASDGSRFGASERDLRRP